MKTIIATTDFSTSSINAVRFAADLAVSVQAKMILYHATPYKVVLVDDWDYNLEYTEIDETSAKLDAVLNDIKSYTQGKLIAEEVMEYGNVDDVITRACNKESPFAVIMAATEKTALDRLLLGSETLSIAHKISVPLLLIPPGCSFHQFKKIIIATDLHKTGDTPYFDVLDNWLKIFQPALDIIYVHKDDKYQKVNVSEAVSLQTHFSNFYPVFHYINDNNVTKGINNFVEIAKPDLLIIVAKKHYFLHKSISDFFIKHTHVPTMILPFKV